MAVSVRLSLSMTCPDLTTAQSYETSIRQAFANAYPQLVAVPVTNPDGTPVLDQHGQPTDTPDPHGVLERQLMLHITEIVVHDKRRSAAQAAADTAEANIRQTIAALPVTADTTTQ